MHCVDLGESFHMSIYLQKLASIQLRTSLRVQIPQLLFLLFLPIPQVPESAVRVDEAPDGRAVQYAGGGPGDGRGDQGENLSCF